MVPVADPELVSQFFYSLKQKQGQTVVRFFQQKLKMFRNMYPTGVTKRQWRDFYLNVAKSLFYSELATDMARFVDTMLYMRIIVHILIICLNGVNIL